MMIPKSWDDVTLGKYVQMVKAKDLPWSNQLANLLGIELSELKEMETSKVREITEQLSFMKQTPEGMSNIFNKDGKTFTVPVSYTDLPFGITMDIDEVRAAAGKDLVSYTAMLLAVVTIGKASYSMEEVKEREAMINDCAMSQIWPVVNFHTAVAKSFIDCSPSSMEVSLRSLIATGLEKVQETREQVQNDLPGFRSSLRRSAVLSGLRFLEGKLLTQAKLYV